MEIIWKVTEQEAKMVMAVLGDIPTKHGLWPLLVNLNNQMALQLHPPPEKKEETET
jgi:hypothetical protein